MILNILKSGLLNAFSQGLYRLSILFLFFLYVSTNPNNALDTTIVILLITFQSMGAAGLSMAAITFITKHKDKYEYSKVILIISFILSLIFSLIFFFMLDIILSFTLSEVNIISNFEKIFLSFSILILCLSSTLKGFYYAFDNTKLIFLASLAAVFSLVFTFFITKNLIYSYILSSISEFIILFFVMFRFLKISKIIKANIDYDKINNILKFILPSFLSSFFLMPVNVLVMGFIGNFYSDKMVNLYNLGMQIRNAIVFLPSSFSPIILKVFSSSVLNNKNIIYILYSVITFCVLIFIIILKGIFFNYFLIIDYFDIILIGMASLFYSLSMVNFNNELSLFNVNRVLFFNVFWGFSFVSLSYFLYRFFEFNIFIPLVLSYMLLFFSQFIMRPKNEINCV